MPHDQRKRTTQSPAETATQYRSPVWVLLGFGALMVGLILYGLLAR